MGFPGGSDGKESACNAGDPGSKPELARSPGEGNGNPLQYSCLKNSMDRGAWRATVHGVTENLYLGQKSCPQISYTQRIAPGQVAACSVIEEVVPQQSPCRRAPGLLPGLSREGRQTAAASSGCPTLCTASLTCWCPIKPQRTRIACSLCRL